MYGRIFTLIAVSFLFVSSVNAAQSTSEDILKGIQEIEAGPRDVSDLSALQLNQLYARLYYHPVASLNVVGKYDTPKGEIGYCFGRAEAARLLARKDFRLNPHSIRKLFIIGNLEGSDGTKWRFHVTTLVHARMKPTEPARWFAVDPIMGRPITMEDWIEAVTAEYDSKEKAYLYFAERDVMMPDVRVFPAPDEETGKRIIELKFEPSTQEFKIHKFGAREVYAPYSAVSPKYFLMSTGGPSGFDYTGLTINETRFHFKGYFSDLIRSLKQPLPRKSMEAMAVGVDEDTRESKKALGLKPSIAESRP